MFAGIGDCEGRGLWQPEGNNVHRGSTNAHVQPNSSYEQHSASQHASNSSVTSSIAFSPCFRAIGVEGVLWKPRRRFDTPGGTRMLRIRTSSFGGVSGMLMSETEHAVAFYSCSIKRCKATQAQERYSRSFWPKSTYRGLVPQRSLTRLKEVTRLEGACALVMLRGYEYSSILP